jgi:hypothetical protein
LRNGKNSNVEHAAVANVALASAVRLADDRSLIVV